MKSSRRLPLTASVCSRPTWTHPSCFSLRRPTVASSFRRKPARCTASRRATPTRQLGQCGAPRRLTTEWTRKSLSVEHPAHTAFRIRGVPSKNKVCAEDSTTSIWRSSFCRFSLANGKMQQNNFVAIINPIADHDGRSRSMVDLPAGYELGWANR